MGQDKSQVNYHGKPQVEHMFGLLTDVCDQVFVSIRTDQSQTHARLPQIHDLAAYENIGPLGGILSAMTLYPSAAWLVLACDLPFMNAEAIAYLIRQRNEKKCATAFLGSVDRLPEPLCSLWEAHGKENIEKLFSQGVKCPRKILLNMDTEIIVPQDPSWVVNANDPSEYEIVKKRLEAIPKPTPEFDGR